MRRFLEWKDACMYSFATQETGFAPLSSTYGGIEKGVLLTILVETCLFTCKYFISNVKYIGLAQ